MKHTHLGRSHLVAERRERTRSWCEPRSRDTAGNPAVTQAVVKPGDVTRPPPMLASDPADTARLARTATRRLASNAQRPGDARPGRRSPVTDPLSRRRPTPRPTCRQTTIPRTCRRTLIRPGQLAPGRLCPRQAAQSQSQPDQPQPEPSQPNEPAAQSGVYQVSRHTSRPGSALDFSLLPAAVRPRMVASPDLRTGIRN